MQEIITGHIKQSKSFLLCVSWLSLRHLVTQK